MPRTILLADDSVTIRKVVELTFLDTDIRVEAVGTGAEAMERLNAIDPDLVLADVVMPEPAGYQICEAVKCSERPVPVLLLAGTFEPFDEQRARECGADGHLVKPFESQLLLDRVEELLARPAVDEAAAAEEPPPSAAAESSAEGRPPPEDLEQVLDDLVASEVEAPPAEPEEESTRPAALPADAEEPGEPVPVRLTGVTEEERPERTEPQEALPLSPEQLDAITGAVIERLSDKVLREIAWEVVPDLAEMIIRERLRQLEKEAAD